MKKNMILIGLLLVGMTAASFAETVIGQFDACNLTTLDPASLEPGWTQWYWNSPLTSKGITISTSGLTGATDRAVNPLEAPVPGCPYYNVYRDFAYKSANTGTATITLSGLSPNGQYEIAVYSYDRKYASSLDGNVADWYSNGSYLLTTICGYGEIYATDTYRYAGTATADTSGVVTLTVTAVAPHYVRINGIEVISSSDCYNFPPEITVATSVAGNYLYTTINTPTTMQVTVADDGRPFVEGCVPSGTPAPLTYQWTVLSGPGTPTFSPSNAVAAPDITFPVAGIYELQLTAMDGTPNGTDEGPKAATKQITVRAKDPALDACIGYWMMEENTGTTVADSSGYDNVGNFTTSTGAVDPNWLVPGAIGGISPNSSLEFHGSTSHFVAITSNPAATPNLDDRIYEATVSAWIKLASQADFLASRSLVMREFNVLRLFRDGNNLLLTLRNPSQIRADIDTTQYNIFDNEWHHVCATYDGQAIRIYLDGYLVQDNPALGWGPASEMSELSVWTIGGYAGGDSWSFVPWKGGIDQVRIYNYGQDEASVQALTLEGINAPPVVNAGVDFQYLLSSTIPAVLNGMVFDVNNNATTSWSVEYAPAGGEVTFANSADPGTTVMFNFPGTYVLRLTATDAVVSKSDTVSVTVVTKTCADVVNDGLTISADISGPSGTPDCFVDLYDLQAFATLWLSCNDPANMNCESPY